MTERNWAGNYAYGARVIHAPSSIEELRALIAAAPRIRVLGSRHSFTDIADSDELVILDRIPAEIELDHQTMTVSVGGAVRYGELAGALSRDRMALANLASLPHISVAGAVSTATHGSGDQNGNLATAVAAVEIVTSEGDVVSLRRGDCDFNGVVVGLGAVGAVTRIWLEVEPTYEVEQRVFERLSWTALLQHFDAINALGYGVSVFSRWGDTTEQVWIKRRVAEGGELLGDDLFGAPAATEHRHPIIGIDPVNATPQLGTAGPWSERLPHFRMGFTPSSGAELQSEYVVARRQGVAAIEAVLGIGSVIGPLLQVSEIRTVAADALWMSPQYGQDTVAMHFTWKPDPTAVERAVAELERVLAPYSPRPHWGKVFLATADEIGARYPRRSDFAALLSRLDPRGAFRNPWLESRVLGRGSGSEAAVGGGQSARADDHGPHQAG